MSGDERVWTLSHDADAPDDEPQAFRVTGPEISYGSVVVMPVAAHEAALAAARPFLGDDQHPDWADYVATNLLDALEQVPDTGDWYGALREWCRQTRTGRLTPNRVPAAARQVDEALREAALWVVLFWDAERSQHGPMGALRAALGRPAQRPTREEAEENLRRAVQDWPAALLAALNAPEPEGASVVDALVPVTGQPARLREAAQIACDAEFTSERLVAMDALRDALASTNESDGGEG